MIRRLPTGCASCAATGSARYEHVALGSNLRLTNLQAAFGVARLAALERLTERRIANAASLTERLASVADRVTTPAVRDGYRHVFHQYSVRVSGDRNAVARALAARGVGTGIHYPGPIHQQPYYVEHGYGQQALPEAEAAARQVLSLPVHPSLSQDELETFARAVIEVVDSVSEVVVEEGDVWP
jgi:perosamine synthetase